MGFDLVSYWIHWKHGDIGITRDSEQKIQANGRPYRAIIHSTWSGSSIRFTLDLFSRMSTTRDPKTFCLWVLFFTELQVSIKYQLYLPWCVRSRFDTLLFSGSSLIQLERVLLIVFAIVSYLWILRIDWAFRVLAQFPWVLLVWYVRISSTYFR
jgi:hypothetical protein